MPHYKVGLDDGSTMQFDSQQMLTKDQIQQVVNQHHPKAQQQPQSFGQKAYNFGQETVPYVAGAMAGMAGSPAGPEVALPAAGLGFAGAKSGMRGLGRILGYEKPSTMGQEVGQTALKDFPVGMAMEGAAPAAKTLLNTGVARGFGKGMAEAFSKLPGVESNETMRLFKNPRSLLPSFLGGPAPLKESGAALGRMESELGIPGIEERTGEQVLKVKPSTGMKPGTVKIQDPNRAYDPSVLESLMKRIRPEAQKGVQESLNQLKSLAGKEIPETNKQVASRVYEGMKKGMMPDLKETVAAIRGVDNRLETMAENGTTEEEQNKFLLGKFRRKLMDHLSEMVPDLQKARGEYASGKVRQAFTSPAFGMLAQQGKDVSRMGVNRMLGPYALYRATTNPMMGALIGATQAPLALGGVTAGAGALAKGLQSKIVPWIIGQMIEERKRKQQQSPTQ